jgi:hypothetical protein
MNETFNSLDHFQLPHSPEYDQKSATEEATATAKMSNSTVPRERRPSTGAPISDLKGPIGPGFTRPKHKRTFTGFGAGEIKSVEGELDLYVFHFLQASIHFNYLGDQFLICIVRCSFDSRTPTRSMEEVPSSSLYQQRGVREGGRSPCRNYSCSIYVQLR